MIERNSLVGDSIYISDQSGDYKSDIGTPQHYYNDPNGSGRYRKGTGEKPQRNKDIYTMYNELRKAGLTEKQILDMWQMKSTKFRQLYSLGSAETRHDNVVEAHRLLDLGYSKSAIGRRMGVNESTVRSWLDDSIDIRKSKVSERADVLKKFVDEHGYVDIGAGTEMYLGCTATSLKNTVAMLEQEGYKRQYYKVPQMGTNHRTTMLVLAAPGMPYKIGNEKFEIPSLATAGRQFDENGNVGALGLLKPVSVDSKRILIKYTEDDGTGGAEKDGLIELRGTPELSLGRARYAQVRIGVDDTHYLKGMAITNNDMPDGIDIIFNTNKKKDVPVMSDDPKADSVLKPMKRNETTGEIDWDNPFGATIKKKDSDTDDDDFDDDSVKAQRHYIDPKTGEKKLSPVNIVSEEGDWSKWGKKLSPQFLGKQKPALAKRQLDLYYADRLAEFEEIKSLTNPTIKKKLAYDFGETCDGDAVRLKAAEFPGQAYHVLLPFKSIKDNECYAPNYPDGQRVALIRFPHAGTFEIPVLTVHNKGSEADNYIHNARDAIGINAKVAKQLSGADFDGDTALVIPLSDKVRLDAKSPLRELKDFDPQTEYKGYEGMKVISKAQQQIEMGIVSNLINDMTLQGAPEDEVARAVKHSMVVIDAKKHKLDYNRSYEENRIRALQETYQKHADGTSGFGAATLLSRSKSEIRVNARKDRYRIDPKTGEKIFEDTKETYTYINAKDSNGDRKKLTLIQDKKNGGYFTIDPITRERVYRTEKEIARAKTEPRTQISTKMYEAKDAYTLTSGGSKEHPGTRMEAVYAEHANRMKALANEARLLYLETPNLKYNKEAKQLYSEQVKSLDKKLRIALSNAPLERQAQLLANKTIAKKLEENPHMDAEHKKKYKGQAINAAREAVGAKKTRIFIEDDEWEAIQHGAISDNKLRQILANTDLDILKQRALPRTGNKISSAVTNKIRMMSIAGYSTAEIAEATGVSKSTVSKYVA